MSTPDQLATDLEQIAAAIEAGHELSEIERRAAAAALRRTMLPEAGYAQRDALIVECRRGFFADRSDHDASHEIATAWRRYAASGWQRDRSAATCPARLAGTLQGAIWAIMMLWPRTLSAERIRQIVGNLR